MTPKTEKIALVLAGISHRVEQYEKVKAFRGLTVRETEQRTGYSQHFIRKSREIAAQWQ